MKSKTGEVRIALEKGENTRTGTSVAAIKQAILDNLYYVQGRTQELATRNDWYMAVAYTVRDRMLDRFIRSLQKYADPKVKIASYLSAFCSMRISVRRKENS
jgi:starch phosphorylase